ncbi:MAG: IS256 family transposase [Gemmatimonadetes bacterium]|nr:IS256 family transposase [Gemmatimonadota bacterium]
MEVSPDLISRVTDAVLEEVREWQNQPLDGVYPVVFFDALRVKIRDEGLVRNKAVYLALAITCEGEKEVLGLWIEQTEGAKFWLKVMNELRTRGVGDILIAVADGLTGFPDAISTVFPQAAVQTCIVHLIRNSLAFVSWKDRKTVMPELGAIYRAETAEAAAARLDAFDARWGKRYPGDRAGLPARLEACGAGVRLPATDPQDDLHHQRTGEPAPLVAQDYQDAGQLPERRGGDQAALSGAPQCRHAMATTH